MTFVIDASVALKWFIEEDLTNQALLFRHGADPLYAPDLIFAEIANAVWRKFTRRELPREQAMAIPVLLQESPIEIIPVALLHQRALEIAIELNHPVYDCLYLACAELAGAVLVTADGRLIQAVQASEYARLTRRLANLSK